MNKEILKHVLISISYLYVIFFVSKNEHNYTNNPSIDELIRFSIRSLYLLCTEKIVPLEFYDKIDRQMSAYTNAIRVLESKYLKSEDKMINQGLLILGLTLNLRDIIEINYFDNKKNLDISFLSMQYKVKKLIEMNVYLATRGK